MRSKDVDTGSVWTVWTCVVRLGEGALSDKGAWLPRRQHFMEGEALAGEARGVWGFDKSLEKSYGSMVDRRAEVGIKGEWAELQPCGDRPGNILGGNTWGCKALV